MSLEVFDIVLVCSIVRIRRTQLFASQCIGLVGHPPLFTRVVFVSGTMGGLGTPPTGFHESCVGKLEVERYRCVTEIVCVDGRQRECCPARIVVSLEHDLIVSLVCSTPSPHFSRVLLLGLGE